MPPYSLGFIMKSLRISCQLFLYHTNVDVARHFNTTRDNVEHCMRTAVSCCWDRGNKDLLSNIAAYPLIEKPTTGEFLDILYHYLSQ